MSTAQIARLTERLSRARRTLDQQIGEARALAHTGRQLQTDIAELTRQADTYARAAAVLTSIGEQRQSSVHTQIETLVTKGLQTIFGGGLSFHLVPVVRGNRPEIDCVVRSVLDGSAVDTPVMDARGGGIAASVGVLLRVVILLLSHDKRDAPLILDESLAHVSAEYLPRWAEFLRELVDKTGLQVIMVTHSDVFAEVADARYRFDLSDGITTVRAI